MRLILPLMGKRERVAHLMVAIEREPGDGMSIDLPERPTAVDRGADPRATSA
jgi:hypothetical protein